MRELTFAAMTSVAAVGLLFSGAVDAAPPITLVVMDPMAKPLSCDCVGDYAQRDYEAFADHVRASTGSEVELHFYESLVTADKRIERPIDVVIGKDSVVRADAAAAGLSMHPVASLTDAAGEVTQRGLIVVRSGNAAQSIQDLSGYTVLFGPPEAEEKSLAIEAALSDAGVTIDTSRRRFEACSEAAVALVDRSDDDPVAAAISSYAEPLLSGCGNIRKGQLRVVGQTDPVPFVSVFVRSDLSEAEEARLSRFSAALHSVAIDPGLIRKLESLVGFIEYPFERTATTAGSKKKTVSK